MNFIFAKSFCISLTKYFFCSLTLINYMSKFNSKRKKMFRKWVLKSMSTDKNILCTHILCCSNCWNIFSSNCLKQVFCLNLILYIPTFVNYYVNSVCRHYINF